jgi:hypothetical protein
MLPAAALLVPLLAGCRADPRRLHGYELAVPAAWERWSGPAPLAPGKVLEAYRVPAAAAPGSLVVFRSPYLPETSVAQLIVQRRNLHVSLAETVIHEAREIEVAGRPAALFDISAQGTGSALSPTGLGKPIPPAGERQLPTRRLWVAIPRGPEQGTLEVFLHYPEEEHEKLQAAWQAVLASLRA